MSFNYRTNIFGFPTSQEISAPNNNLGLLDQELAFAWVQDNIAQFGGDKTMVTLMVRVAYKGSAPSLTLVLQGQSAGSWSVSLAITRREPSVVPPFHAGIMLSGAKVSESPVLNFSIFDEFATAMGCGQPPGPQRLQCLRNVPASTIRAYTNGPDSGLFASGADKYALYPI